MPLPPLIEVVPFSAEQLKSFEKNKAEIIIPGSKSITNRAIVLAALGGGVVTLKGALWSEDTEAMVDCMKRLGIKVDVAPDPEVEANRVMTVHGCNGKIPNGGTEATPLELFVANAGTAAGASKECWAFRQICCLDSPVLGSSMAPLPLLMAFVFIQREELESSGFQKW